MAARARPPRAMGGSRILAKLLMALTMALTALGTPGLDADVFQAGDHYVAVTAEGELSLWAESNGQPGLQTGPLVLLGRVVMEPDTRTTL